MIDRRTLRTGSLLLLAAAVAASASCRGTETKVAPGPVSNLAIVAAFAGTSDEMSTCAGVESWLLWIDTAGTPNGWDQTLLLSGDKDQLYGCDGIAAAPCPDATFARAIPNLSRLMIEGLTVPAPEFSYDTHDVTCRGVADDQLRNADIVVATTEEGSQITANVRFLAVGRSNPMPFTDGPRPRKLRHAAVASFSVREDGIGLSAGPADPRGQVLIAGGMYRTTEATPLVTNEAWVFDPSGLEFSSFPAVGPRGFAGASATACEFQGAPHVLVAGGQDGNDVPLTSAFSVGTSGAYVEHTMAVAHVNHGAVRLIRGDPASPVLLIGGLPFDTSDTTDPDEAFSNANHSPAVSAFYPAEPSGPGALCGAQPTTNHFCAGTQIDQARGFVGAARVGSAGAISFGGIYFDPAQMVSRSGNDFATWTTTNRVGDNAIGLETRGAAAASTFSHRGPLPDAAVAVGGYDNDFTQVRSSVEFATAPTPFLSPTAGGTDLGWERAFARLVPLRDGTILVTGGRNLTTTGVRELERVIPMGNGVDVQTLSPGSELLERRWAHGAVRLEETQSWLDGAVLLVGGNRFGVNQDLVAELFVPAEACLDETTTPVRFGTANEALEPASIPIVLDVCEIGRLGSAITLTDPSDP